MKMETTNACKHLSVLYCSSKPSACSWFVHTFGHPQERVY